MNSTQPARRPTAGSVDKQDRPTVIYIMGYGRSGSTILDILLNQHDDVISVGALANIYEWLLRKEACGCAEKVEACSFWANVCERTLDVADEAELSERRDLQSAVESIRRYPALALGWSSKRRTADYAAEMERLFAAIAETSESRFVVDSSKSAHDCTGRPLALFRHTRLDVKIIHLVRDGRGVAWSVMKGAGSQERKRRFTRPSLNFLRAVAGWTLANFCALVTTRLLPRRAVLRVRYEDLCDAPQQTMDRIGDFIGLDMTRVCEAIEQGRELQTSHNLGGNRVRFTRRLKFRPDQEWRTKMPLSYRTAFRLASWPLTRMLGYGR